MNPSNRTLGSLLTAAALFCAPLAACKKHATMDVPVYPGSSQASSFPNVEGDTGTLFHLYRQTPDRMGTVATFYRKDLVDQRGWTEQKGFGISFTDGNMKVESPGQGTSSKGTVVDPSRPGGHVFIFESGDATYVEIWQHIPKPE